MDAQVADANPLVDVCACAFLEEVAHATGIESLGESLVRVASGLADRLPMEEYRTWAEFLDHLRTRRSMLSAFEDVVGLSDHCFASATSPFARGWKEYVRRVGTFPAVHTQVAEYHGRSHPASTVLTSMHVIQESFKHAAARRIRIGDRGIWYAEIASHWLDGRRRIVEPRSALKEILRRAELSESLLERHLRTCSDIWAVGTD